MQVDVPLLGPLAAVLLFIPLVMGLASAWAGAFQAPVASVWRTARWTTAAGLGAALLCLAVWATGGSRVSRLGGVISIFDVDVFSLSLHLDVLSAVVITLVTFIAWVIVRYSQPYLAGEPRERTYVAWLLATLCAVSLVVLTNNLLVLALAWTVTSVSLHHLLTFYPDRAAARIAAHKKFLYSRVAELCLFVAVILIAMSFGTLEIDQVLARVAALQVLPGDLKLAAILLTVTAFLKCAQLPFHGWLIQVMEAPTPVSALLHAGVVNLGGYVLIRLAPLISAAPVAQTLLVCVGTVTAVLAALVMTTRISIKVQLAWSTCAQMGFMLMQCGLGLYGLGLLHLVAHSLYKAHAFLAAGGVVRRSSIVQLGHRPMPTSIGRALAGAMVGAALVAVDGALWGVTPADQPGLWALTLIMSLALVPLLRTGTQGIGEMLAQLAAAFGVATVYFGLHALSGHWLATPPPQPATRMWLFVLVCFAMLFVIQSVMAAHPSGRLGRALYPWLYAGLFLDDWFSRAAFAIWPVRQPAPSARSSGAHPVNIRGALP